MFKVRNIIIIFLSISFLFQSGCSDVQPGAEIESDVSSRESQNLMAATVQEEYPFSIQNHRALMVFYFFGIKAFYKLNQRVPETIEGYLNSGIPMMIPNDYYTGMPYHRVDVLDDRDTSGFTFSSDGQDSCRFGFKFRDDDTGEIVSETIKFDSSDWQMEKHAANHSKFQTGSKSLFDKVKREFCIFFCTHYFFNYIETHSDLPENLSDMLSGQGELIRSGWDWKPENEREYFEFGVDTVNGSYYTLQSNVLSSSVSQITSPEELQSHVTLEPSERSKIINEITDESGNVDLSKIFNRTKLLSSSDIYGSYLALISEGR